MCIAVAGFIAFGIVTNALLGLYQLVFILAPIGVALFFVFYYSRFKGKFKLVSKIFITLAYLATVAVYFLNEDLNGPTLIVTFITLSMIFTFTSLKTQWVWALLHVIIFGVLMNIEYWMPDQIPLYYQGRAERFFDIFISYILSVAFISLVLWRMRVSLNDQKDLAEEQRDELKIKSDQLEEANGQLNKVFSVISHDLRNPLISVEGYLKTLAS